MKKLLCLPGGIRSPYGRLDEIVSRKINLMQFYEGVKASYTPIPIPHRK